MLAKEIKPVCSFRCTLDMHGQLTSSLFGLYSQYSFSPPLSTFMTIA